MNKNLSEEKKKYEKEFCDLLKQRITHAGGSLQFQHLSGLVQQARFEIRDAFGTTKSELMKFLRAHPKIFVIDSAGIVTISQSPLSDDDTDHTNTEVKQKKNSYSKIEKGIGSILKIHPEFGIIKAIEPIQTHVHFKSQTYFEGKDYLLSDSSLQEGDEVFFNAVHCDDNYDCYKINFRATKVWQKLDECENSNKTYDLPASSELNGYGIVKSLRADSGYISVIDKRERNIFFHRNSVKDCKCLDLTKFLKNGDCVEFFAKFFKDAKTSRWQATSVRKRIQNGKSPANSEPVKTKLENEPGKIYPTSTGAFLKFGKNFTEQADGNSCSYFLYGGEVTDIKWEFNEGDDVFFDAEKTKSSKWKAVLVWVGERPVCFNHKKIFSGNKSEVSDEESVSSSKASSIFHPSKHIRKRSQSASKSKRVEQNKKSDHSSSRRCGRYDESFEKQAKKPPNSEKFSTRKSENARERNINEKDNSFGNRRGRNKNRRGNERILPSKVGPKKSLFSKNVTASYESDEENHKRACNFENNLSYKDNYSNSSQDGSDDDAHVPSEKYLVFKRSDKKFHSAPGYNFSDTNDNDVDNMCNETKSNNADKKIASIKKFNDVEGKIVRLHCKVAFIESSCMQKSVDFMLNAFYLNGKSAEEELVIDLKEVINVGDVVTFNYFEIIDDYGEIHQKATMVWKGPKPEVYEMTPEEFINELDLSVTINKELEPGSLSDDKTSQKNLQCNKDLESTSSESSSESESEEEVSNGKDSRISESNSTEEENADEKENEDKILDVNRSLSDTVLEQLKFKGLIPRNAQVNFSGLLAEVTELVHKQCSSVTCEPKIENPKTLTKPNCPLCEKTLSGENKSENHTAAQTIITGGIIAQSIYTQP